jgi:hypothetical protein
VSVSIYCFPLQDGQTQPASALWLVHDRRQTPQVTTGVVETFGVCGCVMRASRRSASPVRCPWSDNACGTSRLVSVSSQPPTYDIAQHACEYGEGKQAINQLHHHHEFRTLSNPVCSNVSPSDVVILLMQE